MSKKTQTGQRKSLLTGASVLAAAAAAIAATPAMAQDAEDEEAIVVTGTRLVRQDFEAISPITTVGAEQLELTATITTESLLNELPQIIPGNTRTSNNAGGEDFATVDLRGLGPNRTLVLVNGERVPASSTTGTVDINTIPASLISRIEVVTGGASAVYGSDALAGVVNFVLKDDYEGGEVSMTYGSELETGNVAEFEINGLVGGNFANGRGNLTVYGSYYNREGILQSEYDYSRVSGALCYDGSASGNWYFVCDSAAEAQAVIDQPGPAGIYGAVGGSGTPAWGWITNSAAGAGADKVFGTPDDTGNPFGGAAIGNNVGPDLIAGTADDTGIFNNATALFTLLPGQFAAANTDCNAATAGVAVRGGNLSFNDAGQLTPRFTAGACGVPDRAAGSSRYNYAPDNFLVIPGERIALSTIGHYDISDTLRLNVLFNYTNSQNEVQLAPTPATGLTITLTPAMQTLISTNHPDLWTALQSRPNKLAPFVMDRRTNEVGTRNGLTENNAFFFLTSLEGALGDNWDWALSASYGQSSFTTRGLNSVNATALRQGLAGCQNPDGSPMGGSALPGCVALDIFGPGTLNRDPDGAGPLQAGAMTSFIRVNTFSNVKVEENRLSGYIRGDLFELPAGPVASVFGFEYRDTFAAQYNDNEQRTGNIYGFNAIQDTEGQVDVYELYTEISVPLISEQQFAHYLGLEAGFRRSNYSSVGNVDTYKIGGEWAPTEWLRFRYVFNEATRAPSVFELFQAGDQGFPSYTDPCRDTASGGNGVPDVAGVTQAFCVGQGVPVGQYPGFAANNSQVQAFAFGNPNLAPETAESTTYGVVFQPDWFPIGDFRATVDWYEIEITDVVAAFGAQFYINDCYVNGNLSSCSRVVRNTTTGQIFSVNTSRGNQGTFATEGIDIQLEWSVPIGPGQLTINELYSIIDSYQFNGAEFAGTSSAGIGGAIFDAKSVLSLTYNVGDWTLFGRWSYVPELTSQNFAHTTSPESSYIDVATRWNVTDNFTLTVNVDNVMDEYPPQTAEGFFSQANTDPQLYRVLGRSFAISGRYRF
ncbi:MAG: TonB-dependent receptor [Hyphomonadaceae bacterium]|nr:TonB-dependent receptor [Hyphomonadaceae bacterium]